MIILSWIQLGWGQPFAGADPGFLWRGGAKQDFADITLQGQVSKENLGHKIEGVWEGVAWE